MSLVVRMTQVVQSVGLAQMDQVAQMSAAWMSYMMLHDIVGLGVLEELHVLDGSNVWGD